MNIDAAIEIQRAALLRLLAVMFAAVGISDGGSVGLVRQRIRLMVLRMLGAADSATRRLIFLKARGMATPEYVRGPARDKSIPRGRGGKKTRPFPLFDPRKSSKKKKKKRPTGPGPRIFFLDGSDPAYTPEPEAPPISPDDMVNAESLCQRLNALFGALSDLDRQARRLKRSEARRKQSEKLAGQGVLRIKTPPGHRERGSSADERAVDKILRDCEFLARQWIAEQDTS